MNPYEAMRVLELPSGFTPEDLKGQYRKKAKEYHPDVLGDADQGKFHQVNEAYRLLQSTGTPMLRGFTHQSIFNIISR